LRNSSGFNLLLARPKSAPDPPIACSGVIESFLVRSAISSGLRFLASAACGITIWR
jgi:hypothetical protein